LSKNAFQMTQLALEGCSGGQDQELCLFEVGGSNIAAEILSPQPFATLDQYRAWCMI